MTCTATVTVPGNRPGEPATLRCGRDGEHRWHFDRFRGSHWRVRGENVEVQVTGAVAYSRDHELPPEPEDAAEETEQVTSENLPALFARIDLEGRRVLDVDRLRELSPLIRTGLVNALRSAAREVRSARGTVVVPEDTYDLTRRVVAAGEVLRQMRDAFEAAAKEADAIAEEEALTAVGGVPGAEEVPSGSHFVPDGEGQRIAVSPDWKPGESTWDVDTLAAWVAEQVVADEARKPIEVPPGDDPETVPVWSNSEAVSLVRDGIDKLLRLGKYLPGAKAIEAERKRLAGLQRDADAAVLRQVRSIGLRQYKGVKITREPAK